MAGYNTTLMENNTPITSPKNEQVSSGEINDMDNEALQDEGNPVEDADEAVHQKKQEPSEENKLQDADDAVHRAYKPATNSSHDNDERDPDDRVHGMQ